MYKLTLTEKQLKDVLLMLDRELKANGLESLALVVDIHNAIAGVEKVEEKQNIEEVL